MIKAEQLRKGDKVAFVSLSSGSIGDQKNLYRFEIGKKKLEELFGLQVVVMPNALKGKQFVYEHPELRAKDLMEAFQDKSIKAIFTLTGGDDTIRLLPYIDFDIIKNNPKIFMGYSDTTVNHFMMNKAGICSFYGPAVAVEFSFQEVHNQNIKTILDTLFNNKAIGNLEHCKELANDPIDWKNRVLEIEKDKSYQLIQGKGKAKGQFLGGCIDVFPMIIGTSIWPTLNEWENKILIIETSEDQMAPDYLLWYLRNLGAQGILQKINGIIVGRPKNGKYFDEYNEKFLQVCKEYDREDLPILTNCQFGHAWLWNIIPLGCMGEIDCEKQTLSVTENCVIECLKSF